MRPFPILACACFLASCSTDVFETDGGRDGGADASDASSDVLVDALNADAGCPYSGATPMCGSKPSCTGEVCCVTSATAQCIGIANSCSGASLACLTPMECGDTTAIVCCLMNGDAGELGGGCPRLADPQATSQCVAAGECGAAAADHHICLTNGDCPSMTPICAAATIPGATVTFGVCSVN